MNNVRKVLDAGDRINRKNLLDLVDSLIALNRKINQINLSSEGAKSLGIQEVADAVREYDRKQALIKQEAILDRKIKEIKEVLGICSETK